MPRSTLRACRLRWKMGKEASKRRDILAVGALLRVERAAEGGKPLRPPAAAPGSQRGQHSGGIGVSGSGSADGLAGSGGQFAAGAISLQEDGPLSAAFEVNSPRAKRQPGQRDRKSTR